MHVFWQGAFSLKTPQTKLPSLSRNKKYVTYYVHSFHIFVNVLVFYDDQI